MSPLGKRIIVLMMFWVFLVMIFIQVYDNFKNSSAQSTEAAPTVGPDPAISRLADLQACVAADPNDFDCTLELGETYYDNKQWELAQVNLERALALDGDNITARVKLAGTLIYQNQFDQAIPVLNGAVQLNPNSAEIYLLLGLALSKVEPSREAEALVAWRKVIELAPNTALAQQAAIFIEEAK